jgi:hypothetical protein
MFNYIRRLQSKIEALEEQRIEDLEIAETQRRKDLEMAETQRRKDLERTEMQRKRDIEKVEMQKNQVINQAHSLKLDLEGKIESLEQRAIEHELEHKQVDEVTSNTSKASLRISKRQRIT